MVQIPLALAVLISGPCRATGWQSPEQFTHACYSDVAVALSGNAVPLPAGMTMLVDAARAASGPVSALAGRPDDAAAALRTGVDLLTLLISAAACLLVLAAVRLAGRRPWDAALIAGSPVLVTAALVSLDLVAVALVVAGLAAFAWRPRTGWPRSAPLSAPLMSGVLLGAATAVRPIAAAGLVALILLAVRAGRWSPAGAALSGAALTWVAVNLPSFVSSPAAWWQYPRSLVSAEPGYGSLLVLPQVFEGSGDVSPIRMPPAFALAGAGALILALLLRRLLPPSVRDEWLPARGPGFLGAAATLVLVPALLVGAGPWLVTSLLERPPTAETARWVAIIGALAALGAVAVVTLRAQRAPPAPAIALMLIVGWWLVAPSLPVQAGLWVLPLLALTARSWRVVVAWGAVEAIYAVLTWLFLYGLSVQDRGVPASWYALAVLARVSAWIWVAVVAWRNSCRRQRDPVPDPDEAGRRLPSPVRPRYP